MTDKLARLYRHPPWLAVTAAFIFNGGLFGAWASRVPAFKEQFALNAADLGLLLFVFAIGATISFIVAGALSDRLGPQRTTWIATVFCGPGLVLVGVAPDVQMFALSLFVFGALLGGMDVAMNAWGARVEQALRRPVMSGFHAWFSVGAGIGAGTGSLVAGAGIHPSIHFPIIAFLLAIPAIVFLQRADAARLASSSVGATTIDGKILSFQNGPLLLVGLIAFGVSIGEGAMADWSAVFLREVSHAGEGTAALGYTVYSIAMVLTRLMGDSIVSRFGPATTVRASCVIASIGVSIVVFSTSVVVALLGFMLVGVGYAVVMPVVFSRAARDPDVPPGRAIAAVATLGYGGMLIGPVVLGFVAHLTSLPTAFSMLAVTALAAAAFASQLNSER